MKKGYNVSCLHYQMDLHPHLGLYSQQEASQHLPRESSLAEIPSKTDINTSTDSMCPAKGYLYPYIVPVSEHLPSLHFEIPRLSTRSLVKKRLCCERYCLRNVRNIMLSACPCNHPILMYKYKPVKSHLKSLTF